MKIVALDGYTLNPGDTSWRPIEAVGDFTVYDRSAADEIIPRALPAVALMTNKTVLNEEVFRQLPKLKYVTVTATGYNVVDIPAARQRGITVSNVPEYSTDSVAQHVFALILNSIHLPYEHDRAVRAGQWRASGEFCFWLQPLTELVGKTIGIIGFGRIGQAVARIANAFGMRVLANNSNWKQVTNVRFQWSSLDKLVKNSDFVSLHCPQTAETTGLVDKSFLGKMKPTAVLVNASRGGLVIEQDLARALNKGIIAKALVDVVSVEPITDGNPLLSAKNCLITPHIAWATVEARQRLIKITADNIRAFKNGSPINVVT